MSLFTPLFASAVQRSVLGGLDQALGFLFGVARGVLLVAVAFIVYDRAMATDTVPAVDNSRSATVFASFQDSLNKTVPEDAPGWIVERYEELTGTCGAPAQPVDPAVPPAPGAAPAPAPAAPAEPAAPAN
jgi:membrane protein required for colicin V production